MAELGGGRRSVLDGVKTRAFGGGGATVSRPTLMSAGFLSRVGKPTIRGPSVIKLSEMHHRYEHRMMSIVYRVIAEALVSTAEMVTESLSYNAPVWTGTWVPNYSTGLTPGSRFDQYAGFFPLVVVGTPAEAEARARPPRALRRKARHLVEVCASRKLSYKLF